MVRTIYGDDERYRETYFSKYGDDVYFPGDGAKLDDDGYYWLLGRVDDVMNVSGHRISTYEVAVRRTAVGVLLNGRKMLRTAEVAARRP